MARDCACSCMTAQADASVRPGALPIALLLKLAVLLLALAAPFPANGLPPLEDVAQLAVGERHACVLTDAGAVRCWGNNQFGQLGDGTTEHRYLPVTVAGLDGGVVSVASGFRHSCAVTTGGGVKCWGKNLLGQLGDGSTSNRSTPVAVVGLGSGVASVHTGGDHSCALGADGTLRCWGYNGYGQLGTGNTSNQPTPVLVPVGNGNTAIATGYSNTCALSSAGAVRCWGVYDRACNSFGCSFAAHLSPTSVAGLASGVTAIAAGEFFNCAITTGGAVACWGDNYDGQLGNLGTTDPDPFTLFAIDGLGSGVLDVSAGDDHACALRTDGSVRCWGRNGQGQLGDGSSTDRFPPVPVAGLGGVAQVGAGGSHSCARTDAGGVQCWGNNGSGQLGDNEPWFRSTPIAVPGLDSGVTALSTGAFHNCAVAAGGAVKCWGANASGQLGDGSTIMRPLPVTVAGLGSGALAITAGTDHSCAVVAGGAARCWGANAAGQLGNGGFQDQLVPVQVHSLTSGVTQLSAGERHTCARTSAGGARCWGNNVDSQLGDGSLATQTAPVNVSGLASGVAAVAAGSYHSCAIAGGGSIRCWGANSDGQVGNGSTDTQFTPTVLEYPAQGVSRISAGDAHTCALATAGEALCWGSNDDGRLGTGFAFGIETTPVRVQGLASGVADISAGLRHSCAATVGGAALCWGENLFGQLGDASTTQRNAPVAVAGLAAGTQQVHAGGYHSCALSSTGAVHCWGDNSAGQLGIGRREHRLPGPVLDDPTVFRSGFESS